MSIAPQLDYPLNGSEISETRKKGLHDGMKWVAIYVNRGRFYVTEFWFQVSLNGLLLYGSMGFRCEVVSLWNKRV